MGDKGKRSQVLDLTSIMPPAPRTNQFYDHVNMAAFVLGDIGKRRLVLDLTANIDAG